MSTEPLKRIAREWREEVDDTKDFSSVDEYIAPNAVFQVPR